MKNKNKRDKNFLKNEFYWFYLVCLFLILVLPLLNLPPWFSPPDWGKTIVFRSILSILIFVFSWQFLFKSFNPNLLIKFKFTSKTVLYLLLALFLVFLLATIFSLDSHYSLWGSPYRSGGFVNFAFYIIFAVFIFLILKEKDWQKIWDFSIMIGLLVSLVAIFQQLHLLGDIFISFETRPPATIGNPIFLGIYLLLLTPITFSFALLEKHSLKKAFYFLSFAIFLLVIFITASRAAYLGIIIGILYFVFFYPKKVIWLKIFALGLLTGIIYGYLYIMSIFGYYDIVPAPQQFPSFIQNNKVIEFIISRTPVITGFEETSRFSGWKVSLAALRERSILGYGPENFAIGFDRFYNPSLPGIERMPGVVTNWWDRAHNFIFDIGVTAGIPALIIYLALFAVLFWQLQKVKRDTNIRMHSNDTNNVIISHGIQATFIGYLVANFFSFDSFSSYLISFLLIGYSLFLIHNNNPKIEEASNETTQKRTQKYTKSSWRFVFSFVLFGVVLWFIWQYNLKPFQINAQINTAKNLVKKEKCELAISKMEQTLEKGSTFLDNYLRLKYTDFLRDCESALPERKLEFAKTGYELLKENIKKQPYYTRNWLLLGSFTTVLIERDPQLAKELELKKEANDYFEKAYQLSPKRQEVFIEWIKMDLVIQEYEKAIEKSQQCINLNPNLSDCYWWLGVSQAFTGSTKEAKENIETAKLKRYDADSLNSLSLLAKAYTVSQSYPELVEVYQKLIKLKPEEVQYHASLAFVYKEMGQFENARKEALIVLELMPEARAEVEEFLKTLGR